MYSRLEIRLLNYFLLIAFAVILIGAEFYFELDNAYGQNICSKTALPGGDIIPNPLEELRNKILIMFAVLSLVVAIVLMMFIRNITHPLNRITVAAKRINEGDLSQTIAIENTDEISEVGTAINDLASNLQEVVSYTSLTSTQALELLSSLRKILPDNKEILILLDEAQDNIQSINNFACSFKLLNTEFTNV